MSTETGITDAVLIKWLLDNPKTIMLWGDSGDGKTCQLGELATFLYLNGRSAEGAPLKTVLYTADEGGVESIKPQIDLGIIEVISLARRPDPWSWSNAIAQGFKLDSAGKLVARSAAERATIGMWAFEGTTSIGEALRAGLTPRTMGQKPAAAGDKDAHGRTYGQAQEGIADTIRLSFTLPGIKLWTARARRGEDDATASVLGPQVVGKALTAEIPSWFNYTFRVMAVPADEVLGIKEAHRLFLGDHMDRGLKGLGNQRRPLDGGDVPGYIEPASLVGAFRAMANAGETAVQTLRAQMRAKGLIK